LLIAVANEHVALVTVEEGALMGGAGSAVLEALQAAGLVVPVLQLGLADQFIEHGDPVKLLALQGLDAQGIEASIRHRFRALLEPAVRIA
jgi:1-deoxy-D-xylulose-5-phosphate synthase